MTHRIHTTPHLYYAQGWQGVLAAALILGMVGGAVAATQIHSRGRWRMDLDGTIGPVYTVADLRQRVVQAPRAWMGRTVRVRALVLLYRTRSDPFTWRTHLLLIDPGAAGWVGRMPLVLGAADPVLAMLRRLPLVGPIVPHGQQARWTTAMSYRIELQARPSPSCPACYEAVLLDAA